MDRRAFLGTSLAAMAAEPAHMRFDPSEPIKNPAARFPAFKFTPAVTSCKPKMAGHSSGSATPRGNSSTTPRARKPATTFTHGVCRDSP